MRSAFTNARRFVLPSLLLGLLAAPAAAAGPAGKVPRYRLQVGQELTYRGSDEFKYDRGRLLTRTSWRIWVVRANPDGSWRLVIRYGSAFSQGPGEAKEDVTFAYCDLFPDGRIVENDSFGFRMNPRELLPRLPRDEAEAAGGWTGRNRRMDETYRYRAVTAAGTAGRFVFEAVREAPMNAIYGFEFKDTITFDTRRGLPEEIVAHTKQTYGFNGQGQGTTKLEGVKERDASWCRDFAAEADRYFAAVADYRRATREPKPTVAQTRATLDRAVEGLKALRKELKVPELVRQVDELLAEHDRLKQYRIENAENRAAVLDKPSPDWSTTDLDGKPHALKDYRGKVVILDFWYRGCGWCVRSMPQMKQIAAHFKGRPVAVLGMNTDSKLADAQFVVEKMGLNYTNLKASGLPEKYKIRGFPTLFVIDPEGVVRDIHVGYSPTLREEVVRSVEKLLPSKPTASR
jgi:peroxiredoxin